MIDWLLTYSDKLFGPLFDPTKRIFIGYVISAAAIALFFYWYQFGFSLQRSARTFLSPKVLWSRSAQADYKLLAINQAIMMGVAPKLISKLALATLLFETLHIVFAGRPSLWPTVPGGFIAIGYTVVLFLLDDCTKYILHRLLHRIPLLWAFHKVHHSAETLTPITVFRTHPVEGVLFAVRASIVQASAIAIFIFFFADRVELVSVLGANLFLFAFNLLGANLRHSHVPIRYGRVLEHLFISPAQHQIHHSVDRRHHDRNFGAILAVWDLIGGTLYVTRTRERLTFGLGNEKPSHALWSLYLVPFTEATELAALKVRKVLSMIGKMFTPMFVKPSHASARIRAGLFTAALAVGITPLAQAFGESLNIYSHRQPFLIQPFIEAYTAKTGTDVNIVFAKKGLAQRLQAEGENSPADIVLTVDIARLHVYADKDLLAPVQSTVLQDNIPAHLRDPENRWFAFSKRARIIAVHKEAEGRENLRTYADLATEAWRDRVCSRPGSHVYNRALIASIIHSEGEAAAEEWAKGVVANLARRPQGNDRAQIKAIFEGQCDVTVVNNYYIGKLASSDKEEQREWADAVDLVFPDQDGRGTHINISGGGVAKHSKNKDEAIRFLEFLTTEEAQKLYGTINYEFPVNPDVPAPDAPSFGGTFKEDTMPISKIAELAPLAQRIIDRAGW